MIGFSAPAVLAVVGGLLVVLVGFIPYLAWSCRRRGRFGAGHAFLVGCAAVYVLALWTYTILPLPDPALVCADPSTPQLRPLQFLRDLASASRGGGSVSAVLMQLVLNVLLFVPLGMLLRHLCCRGFVVTVLLGLAASGLIELTQLTGNWGLYPCAYRLMDVDDLIANTTGTALGFLAAPALRLVPGQEVADPGRPQPVTWLRRVLGMVADVLLVEIGSVLLWILLGSVLLSTGAMSRTEVADAEGIRATLTLLVAAALLVVVPLAGRGATPGQRIVLVRPQAQSGDPPSVGQRLVRAAAGSGGYVLLETVGTLTGLGLLGGAAWVLGVSSLIVATLGDHRGLSGMVARLRVVDGRTPRVEMTDAERWAAMPELRRLWLAVVAGGAVAYLVVLALLDTAGSSPLAAGALLVVLVLVALAQVAFLLLNGLAMTRREGRSLGNLLTLLLGLALVGLTAVTVVVVALAPPPVVVLVGAAWLLVAYLGLLFWSFVLYGLLYARRDPDPGADSVVVLGSGIFGTRVPPLLAARLRRGREVLEAELARGGDAVLVCSGGQGPGEDVPEAVAMSDHLVAAGADPALVRRETASRSTEAPPEPGAAADGGARRPGRGRHQRLPRLPRRDHHPRAGTPGPGRGRPDRAVLPAERGPAGVRRGPGAPAVAPRGGGGPRGGSRRTSRGRVPVTGVPRAPASPARLLPPGAGAGYNSGMATAATLPRARQGSGPARETRHGGAPFVLPVLLAVSILYLELLLRLGTGAPFLGGGLLYLTLFAGVAALVALLVISFLHGWARVVLTGTFLVLVTLLFMAQLVYHDVFGTYFTVFSAVRGGQVAQFTDVIGLAISRNAVLLLLCAVPLLLLALLPKRSPAMSYRFGWFARSVAALLALLLHGVGMVAMSVGSQGHASAYDAYHRSSEPVASVEQLGLLTTTRLDLQRTLLGFEPELAPPPMTLAPRLPADRDEPADQGPPTPAGGSTRAVPEPVAHGENAMDIDFAALGADTDDEVLRSMHDYFGSLTPSAKNDHTGRFEGYNLVFLTAEAFSHYAVDEEVTPTLYRMAEEGYTFTDFYNPVWGVSTSDGEYVATTGLIPKSGVWSMLVSGENSMPFAMGNQLGRLGYTTKAYHDHTFDYYGRDISHPNLGYDYKALGNGLDVTPTWPESDVEMIDITTKEYVHDEPFHAYYMTVSGHLLYNWGGNFIAGKNRDLVQDLPYGEAGKAYMATQIELDRALELLLDRLQQAGVADRTLIVLSADHYPYGLEKKDLDDLAGHEVDERFELHRSSLIIYSPGMEHEVIEEPVASMDIIPTLSNLLGLEFDSRLLMGRDVFSGADPLVVFNDRSFITEKGRYDSRTGEFTPVGGADVPDGYRQSVSEEVDRKFWFSAQILDRDYYRLVVDRR
ncbi:sulfatase-like hydrolase/transferase [Ornithinimicrobium avium]|uniref:Sulfatase N-terminal domain-containing protein n=2 Tax=Ornithinimicrobium avium TaxID=2283195 RepID=A0A345NRS5_9MICO|nr:sulfatase-like hydrolase/transferase [Ornithinimicrobium avium]AXH97733.1 hypothetical protein DV701_17895 [Ornithinimicrobium avium]